MSQQHWQSPGSSHSRGRGRGGFRGRGRGGGGSGGPPSDRGGPREFSRGHTSPGFSGGRFSQGGPGRGRGQSRGGGRGGAREGGSSGSIFLPNTSADVDTRLAENSDLELVDQLNALALDSPAKQPTENDVKHGLLPMPLRPDYGTEGTPITLRANFFGLDVPEGPWYEYSVEFSPASVKERDKKRIFELAQLTGAWAQAGMAGKVAHDWSDKLVAVERLPDNIDIPVSLAEEGQAGMGTEDVLLTIKFVQEIGLDVLKSYVNGDPEYRNHDIAPIILALNLVTSAHARANGILVGQNKYFFRTAEPPSPLGGAVEAWRGFFSSVRPIHGEMAVNVHVKTKAFYVPMNLLDAMGEYASHEIQAHPVNFVPKVKIVTTYSQKCYTVTKLADVDARGHSFHYAKLGRKVTVEEYFKHEHDADLKHPERHLIDVTPPHSDKKGKGKGKGERKDDGGSNVILLPAELCMILPNQPYNNDLTSTQTSAMINIACRAPAQNASDEVNKGLSLLGFNPRTAVLDAFGVNVDDKMAVVPGRILPTPSITYSGKKAPEITSASWNMRNLKFSVGATLSRWAVLCLTESTGSRGQERKPGMDVGEARGKVGALKDMCVKSGMRITGDPTYQELALPHGPAPANAIHDVLVRMKPIPQLVLVVLPREDTVLYDTIKFAGDVDVGMSTVCVQSSQLRKGNMTYLANVALKINMKAGGVNHKLDQESGKWLFEQPTMLVGMDVTHSTGSGSFKWGPSIASVVASIDNSFGQYPGSLDLQKARKEMIVNVKNMIIQRLELYKKHNKRSLPERIIIFRDGVSEGQYKVVRKDELPEIKAAFREFDKPGKPYDPKLSIIICGKRHNTRTYPTNQQWAEADGNTKPGTVVDRGITAVYDFDFYLQPHKGLKGTARSTHYFVLHDENGFKSDSLQGLVHALCYTFMRATKAVSLAPPAYYADIACERGRCYIRKMLVPGAGEGREAWRSSEDGVMKEAQRIWQGGVSKDGVKDTMFYL